MFDAVDGRVLGRAWDYECGFVDERTVIASTRVYEQPQHWLIDTTQGNVLGQLEYPMPVTQSPMTLGDGTWLTCGEDPFRLLLWNLAR